jgi:predicted translin family RNA/ssDNA-binding protein
MDKYQRAVQHKNAMFDRWQECEKQRDELLQVLINITGAATGMIKECDQYHVQEYLWQKTIDESYAMIEKMKNIP